MDTIFNISLGLGLAAAAGLRVFVPVLGAGLAAYSGAIELSPGFAWVASPPALLAFGTATVLEIGAYYVPWLDHLLDVAATPAAVAAGVITSAAVIVDLPPLVTWVVALIGGGGAAGIMQLMSVTTRVKSTFATGGLGNPLVATTESAGAVTVTAIAILIPILSVCFLLAFALLIVRLSRRLYVSRRPARP